MINKEQIIAEAIGEASMLWSETPKGVFESTKANELVKKVIGLLSENVKEESSISKSLGNTTASQAKNNVKDIVFWGNGDAWKLLGKASSVNEGWMKSSKAYEIEKVGCIVQVTTQQGSNVAEALTFVPDVKIHEVFDGPDNKVIARQLVRNY